MHEAARACAPGDIIGARVRRSDQSNAKSKPPPDHNGGASRLGGSHLYPSTLPHRAALILRHMIGNEGASLTHRFWRACRGVFRRLQF